MIDWRDRIKEARLAKGLGQKALGKLVGVSQAAIGKIENHDSQSTEALEELCEVLGLDPDIMPPDAFGKPRVRQRQNQSQTPTVPLPDFAKNPAYWAAAAGLIGDVPLYASAEGGEGSLIIERDPIGSEPRPPSLQGVKDGYAIYLTGWSMAPEFEEGDTLFVNPRLPAITDKPCVFYSNEENEVRALVKRYISSTDEVWNVRQFRPEQDFTLKRADWPVRHRVVSKNFRR